MNCIKTTVIKTKLQLNNLDLLTVLSNKTCRSARYYSKYYITIYFKDYLYLDIYVYECV